MVNAPVPGGPSAAAAGASVRHAARYVVAIDFGTSHSGFAYSHKGEDKKVEAFYTWKAAPMPYAKTLTSLLYGSDGTPEAWGYEAQVRFSRMKPAERARARYEERFKLLLDEQFCKDNPDKARGRNAVSLIGDYLKFMKEHIVQTMMTKFGQQFSLAEVQWCLTVPAMWSDKAKFLTRKAAAYAGLIDEPNDPRLSIILEPEAAALYIATEDAAMLQNGDVFMILDAGGGTVDLTVHEVKVEDGSFRFTEVAPGLGKSCGATFVDDNFSSYMSETLGESATKYLADNPQDMVSVKKVWETVKRQFTGEVREGEVDAVALPNKVLSAMTDADRERLTAAQGDEYEDALVISDGKMRGFFESVFAEIDDLVDTMLDRCGEHRVTKIMCVGGFSESHFLVNHVRERYEAGRNIQVYCPASPGSAVVKGAAYYGLNPSVIAARRCRMTYGLAVRGYWDSSFPDDKRTWDHYQRTWMVEDKFDVLVRRGEAVEVDRVVKRTYYPPAIWSTSIKLSMYATVEPNPRFVDEPGCSALGEITVPLKLDKDKSINDYPIQIMVQFGASEINVRARNEKTMEAFKAEFSYDMDAHNTAAENQGGQEEEKGAPSASNKRAWEGEADNAGESDAVGKKRKV